jgi:hypothetical protein
MNTPGRIQIHGAGVGELCEHDIERRALEIAQMDGRTSAHAGDRLNAREELVDSSPPPAPEGDDSIRLWSDAESSVGHMAPRIGPEDEISPVEQLINEGLEEAERDQRLSASENMRDV